jgi:hypothetical protein
MLSIPASHHTIPPSSNLGMLRFGILGIFGIPTEPVTLLMLSIKLLIKFIALFTIFSIVERIELETFFVTLPIESITVVRVLESISFAPQLKK